MPLSINHVSSKKKYFGDHNIEHVDLVPWCLERLPVSGSAVSSVRQLICLEHTFDLQTSQSCLLFSMWFLHFSIPLSSMPQTRERMARAQPLLRCLPMLSKAPNLNPAHLPPHPTHSTEATSEAFVCAFLLSSLLTSSCFPTPPCGMLVRRCTHLCLACRAQRRASCVFLSNSTYSLDTKFKKLEICCFGEAG